MGEYLDQIPEEIRDHIKQISKSSDAESAEEAVEAVAKGWLDKKVNFEEQIQKLNLEEVDFLSKDDERGALIMTYSGSLLTIGPLSDGNRKVEYTSIGLRQDVPESATVEDSEMSTDIELDEEVSFAKGPIKKSSPVFKIAVLRDDVDAAEQQERLSQATQILTEEFVEVNKTLIIE
jgi:hypothetical protein